MRNGIRIGVVGVGGMGTFHATTLAGMAGVEVVAVADPDTERCAEVAATVGAEAFEDPMAVAGSTELDGVVFAGPDETHAEQTLAALANRTPVLCEKPLATSPADAREVVDAELSVGRRLVQLGLMREYDPGHVQVHEALAAVGDVLHVRTVHRNVHPEVRPLERIVRQSLVHDIHSIRWVTGAEFVDVTAFGSGPAGDSFRCLHIVCRLDSGATAACEFDDQGFGYDVVLEVTGELGDVHLGQPTRALERSGGDLRTHVGADWFARFGDAYSIQDRAWIESIRSGVATGPTAWDGYLAELVVEAMLASFEQGGTVAVPAPATPDLYASG